MSAARFVLGEAWHEARLGLSSRVMQVLFVLLALYGTMVLSNAGYLREMGAIDVPRNAPSVVYVMSAGQMLWMIMAWAWLFAQPILRDHRAQCTEIVLASPISLRRLLLARYLGGLLVGSVLGLSTAAGFLLVTPLDWVGFFPEGTVGPVPWAPLAYSWVLFTLPPAVGLGALYTAAALRTRSIGGPTALSAVLVLGWMISMVIMKSGDISPFVRGVVDSSLYAETIRQVEQMTPLQRGAAYLEFNATMLVNRLVWGLAPLLVLAVAFARVTREHLVVGPASGSPQEAVVAADAPTAVEVFARPAAPRWWVSYLAEARWQLRLALGGVGVRLSATFLLFVCLAGSMVHVLQHAEGPFVPRPFLLAPKLAEFLFLVVAFVIAGVGGVIARRDDVPGFGEMLDASPAPEWIRHAGRATAVAAIALVFTAIPAVASMLLTAVWAPDSFSLSTPWIYQMGLLGPALLEVAALVIVAHAAFRNAGLAHTLSVAAVFVVVINHELDIVSYPTLEVAIPVHADPSVLTGWAPFLAPMAAGAAFKIVFATGLMLVGLLLLPRGVEALGARRLQRLRGGLGAALAATIVLGAALAAVQYRHYVVDGDYETSNQALASRADWERDAHRPVPWSVEGGRLELTVEPGGTTRGRWTMTGVRIAGPVWTASVPRGFVLGEAMVAGRAVAATVHHDQLDLPMDGCRGRCDVELGWTVAAAGWSAEGEAPWSSARGVWLRAELVVPRPGVDPERFLAPPRERALHGLPAEIPWPAASEATARGGVAPPGDWSWAVTIEAPTGPVAREGRTSGPLEVVTWWSPSLQSVDQGGVRVWAPETHAATAASIAADLTDARAALAKRLGEAVEVRDVVQAPRGWGDALLADGVLLLPEAPSWDVADDGPGHLLRREHLARVLARSAVHQRAVVRDAPGSAWLDEGVPGALALLSIGDREGGAVAADLLDHEAQDTTAGFGSSRTPIGALEQAQRGGWIESYLPLAMLHWTAAQSPEQLDVHLRAGRVPDELAAMLGEAPRASDLRIDGDGWAGRRSIWSGGGWVDEEGPLRPWHPTPDLQLDAWGSYERSPRDNLRASP